MVVEFSLLPALANLIQPSDNIRIIGVSDGFFIRCHACLSELDQMLLLRTQTLAMASLHVSADFMSLDGARNDGNARLVLENFEDGCTQA